MTSRLSKVSLHIYVGFATGGLWKSMKQRHDLATIFDTYSTASIGDIAVSQSNPDIVWVELVKRTIVKAPASAMVSQINGRRQDLLRTWGFAILRQYPESSSTRKIRTRSMLQYLAIFWAEQRAGNL